MHLDNVVHSTGASPMNFFSRLRAGFAVALLGLFVSGYALSAEPKAVPLKTYKVSPKYGQTLEQMIAAGKYDFVNPWMSPANFAVAGTGPATVEVALIPIDSVDGFVGAEVANDTLLRNGYRPATVTELLALGAEYPSATNGITVAATGTLQPVVTSTGQKHMVVSAIESHSVKMTNRLGAPLPTTTRRLEVFGAGVMGFRSPVYFAAVKK
jgi:hypothetical protein